MRVVVGIVFGGDEPHIHARKDILSHEPAKCVHVPVCLCAHVRLLCCVGVRTCMAAALLALHLAESLRITVCIDGGATKMSWEEGEGHRVGVVR